MQKILSIGWVLLISIHVTANTTSCPALKTGDWTGILQLTETARLPFKVQVEKISSKNKKANYLFTIVNGEEKIELEKAIFENDSLHISFSSFNSKLVLKATNKKTLIGYWQNFNKGINYKIPCSLKLGYKHRFENDRFYLSSTYPPFDFNGRWESTFEPNTPDAYKAVGIFNQESTTLNGTFLTETGDYRFLEGNVLSDSLFLSCFDGTHAFLFTGSVQNGIINGRFYSGKHWQTDWTAVKNEKFELAHPDSLTTLVNEKPVEFNLKDLNGNNFTFPNEDFVNKVTIIQIMGTWCPNCMDETRYLKDLYAKYHAQGLEIISIGYEVGNDFQEHAARIQRLKDHLDLDYTFLVGGTANKGLASEHFNMLSQIISFPTAIIIGRDGSVKKIHTGFNGPGTGTYYQDFIVENDLFIQSLLKQ